MRSTRGLTFSGFTAMATKLDASETIAVHTTIRFEFSDLEQPWTLTIRRGVLEVAAGAPLPETPAPVATLQTDSLTWKRLALGDLTPLAAVTSGALTIEGSRGALIDFLAHFETRLTRE